MAISNYTKVNIGEFDLWGYEVIRAQFFASASMTSVSFSRNGIRFSNACIRKFSPTEYIEFQVNPFTLQIAVLPCSEQHKPKMRWARIYADSISVRPIYGSAFLETLYELFDWNIELRYRLRGEVLQYGDKTVALFDTQTPEIFTSRYDMRMPWAAGFGDEYYNYKTSRLPETSISDYFSEYNNEPELQPTAQEDASDHILKLIEKMQMEGRCADASTDILT